MDTFTALAEPTRRSILEMLAASGNLSATDIYRGFRSSPPAISQHLKVLRDAKLVRVEKRAQQRIYYINPEPMKELEKWVRQFAAAMEDRYQALDKILEIEKQRISANNKKEKK
jgi:DNA-binding transcriptional ArsR family regulator